VAPPRGRPANSILSHVLKFGSDRPARILQVATPPGRAVEWAAGVLGQAGFGPSQLALAAPDRLAGDGYELALLESGSPSAGLLADVGMETAGLAFLPLVAAFRPSLERAGHTEIGLSARPTAPGRSELTVAQETPNAHEIKASLFVTEAIEQLIAALAQAGILVDAGRPLDLKQLGKDHPLSQVEFILMRKAAMQARRAQP
jgi:hypothetical protein